MIRRITSFVSQPSLVRPGARGKQLRKAPAQSMVEFALIFPLLFAITVGIIEFGWLFNNHMQLHYATHEGARTGAVAARDLNADDQVMEEVRNDTQTLVYHDPMRLRIYKAGLDGLCVDPCEENIYDWNGDSWDAVGSPGWLSGNRKDVEPTDALGVEIIYQHYFLFSFLPGATGHVEIRDHSVLPIEAAYFAPP
jgi:hypothetical protein